LQVPGGDARHQPGAKPRAKRGSGIPRDAELTDATSGKAATYTHPESKAITRPDVGLQREFKKNKDPKTYRYDSSLSVDGVGREPGAGGG
jgi:hypothetical protein